MQGMDEIGLKFNGLIAYGRTEYADWQRAEVQKYADFVGVDIVRWDTSPSIGKTINDCYREGYHIIAYSYVDVCDDANYVFDIEMECIELGVALFFVDYQSTLNTIFGDENDD